MVNSDYGELQGPRSHGTMPIPLKIAIQRELKQKPWRLRLLNESKDQKKIF